MSTRWEIVAEDKDGKLVNVFKNKRTYAHKSSAERAIAPLDEASAFGDMFNGLQIRQIEVKSEIELLKEENEQLKKDMVISVNLSAEIIKEREEFHDVAMEAINFLACNCNTSEAIIKTTELIKKIKAIRKKSGK